MRTSGYVSFSGIMLRTRQMAVGENWARDTQQNGTQVDMQEAKEEEETVTDAVARMSHLTMPIIFT